MSTTTTGAHRITIENADARVRVMFCGTVIADTTRAKVMHEGSMPAVYYIPEADLAKERLVSTEHHTHCPFKGTASYYDVVVGERTAENAVWYYPEPIDAVAAIKDHVAFYPERVGEIRVEPG